MKFSKIFALSLLSTSMMLSGCSFGSAEIDVDGDGSADIHISNNTSAQNTDAVSNNSSSSTPSISEDWKSITIDELLARFEKRTIRDYNYAKLTYSYTSPVVQNGTLEVYKSNGSWFTGVDLSALTMDASIKQSIYALFEDGQSMSVNKEMFVVLSEQASGYTVTFETDAYKAYRVTIKYADESLSGVSSFILDQDFYFQIIDINQTSTVSGQPSTMKLNVKCEWGKKSSIPPVPSSSSLIPSIPSSSVDTKPTEGSKPTESTKPTEGSQSSTSLPPATTEVRPTESSQPTSSTSLDPVWLDIYLETFQEDFEKATPSKVNHVEISFHDDNYENGVTKAVYGTVIEELYSSGLWHYVSSQSENGDRYYYPYYIPMSLYAGFGYIDSTMISQLSSFPSSTNVVIKHDVIADSGYRIEITSDWMDVEARLTSDFLMTYFRIEYSWKEDAYEKLEATYKWSTLDEIIEETLVLPGTALTYSEIKAYFDKKEVPNYNRAEFVGFDTTQNPVVYATYKLVDSTWTLVEADPSDPGVLPSDFYILSGGMLEAINTQSSEVSYTRYTEGEHVYYYIMMTLGNATYISCYNEYFYSIAEYYVNGSDALALDFFHWSYVEDTPPAVNYGTKLTGDEFATAYLNRPENPYDKYEVHIVNQDMALYANLVDGEWVKDEELSTEGLEVGAFYEIFDETSIGVVGNYGAEFYYKADIETYYIVFEDNTGAAYVFELNKYFCTTSCSVTMKDTKSGFVIFWGNNTPQSEWVYINPDWFFDSVESRKAFEPYTQVEIQCVMTYAGTTIQSTTDTFQLIDDEWTFVSGDNQGASDTLLGGVAHFTPAFFDSLLAEYRADPESFNSMNTISGSKTSSDYCMYTEVQGATLTQYIYGNFYIYGAVMETNGMTVTYTLTWSYAE